MSTPVTPLLEPDGQAFVEPDTEPPSLCVDEPLTDSEMRVLRYLPTQLTAPEIARQLFLSVHTVTTHTRHIYAKLGVRRRHEAVDRARPRGLLAPIQGLRPVAGQPAPRSTAPTLRTAPPPGAWGPAPPTATVNSRRARPAPRCPRIRTRPSAGAPSRPEEQLTKAATVAAWRPEPATPAVVPVGVPVGDGAGSMFWPAAGSRVASLAYVGPGNFDGKAQGGAQYGYPLLWVVRGMNMIMVVQ